MNRPVTVALDGWYGVPWAEIVDVLVARGAKAGLQIVARSINTVFKPLAEVEAYKVPYIGDDPAFGVCNTEGLVSDLMNPVCFSEYEFVNI